MKWLTILTGVIFMFSLVNAQSQYSDCEVYGNCQSSASAIITSSYGNNTNSSIYWGNYLWTDYNMPTILKFAYNHTLSVFNLYGIWFYNMTIPAINYANENCVNYTSLNQTLNKTYLYTTGTNSAPRVNITPSNFSAGHVIEAVSSTADATNPPRVSSVNPSTNANARADINSYVGGNEVARIRSAPGVTTWAAISASMDFVGKQIRLYSHEGSPDQPALTIANTAVSPLFNSTGYWWIRENVTVVGNIYDNNLTQNRMCIVGANGRIADYPEYVIDETGGTVKRILVKKTEVNAQTSVYSDIDGATGFSGVGFTPNGTENPRGLIESEWNNLVNEGVFGISLLEGSKGYNFSDFQIYDVDAVGNTFTFLDYVPLTKFLYFADLKTWIDNLGNWHMGNKNQKYYAGDGGVDYASFTYNGTDSILNPKETGTGKQYVLGDLRVTGNIIGYQNLSVKRPYWVGYDNSTQHFMNTANAQVINISNNADYDNYGIYVKGGTNVTFDNTGDYLCTLSPEFFQSSGGSALVTFWFQKCTSGTCVDTKWSNSRYTIPNNGYNAPSINYQFDITNPATELIRFMWWSDSTSTQLYSSGALTSPTRPSIPAILLNCLKVSEIT